MICSGSLVNALLIQGNLKEAETEYLAARAIEQEWIQQGSPPLNEAGKLMAIYSEVLYERNKLKTAYNLAQESILRCEKWGHIEHQIDGFVSLSRISSAMGRTKKSLLCIEQARSICTEHLARLDQSRFPQWNQKLLHKLWKVESAEVFIAYQNHQVEWLDRWIADHVPGHSIQEMSEFTRIMYTRILIQRGLKDQAYIALSILSQLFSIDQQPHPRYREALLWILTACARHTIGETDLALDALRKSITISETEGYVRIYLNIGAPAAHLLTLIQEDPSLPESTKTYGKQILDSFDYGSQQNIDPDEFYPDRLTAREKDVLHQLASGQSNSDIAINLYISENTVKTHLKHIYEKLQASNRVELIETARQLGLLP